MFCAPLLSTHRRQQVVQQAVCHSERVRTSTNTNTREAISCSSSSGLNASVKSQGKGKVFFFFFFETTISSSFPSSSTRLLVDLFSLLRRTKSAAANQSICGVSPQWDEIASRIASSFFARSLTREIACSSRKGHTLPKIYWTYYSYNDLADRPEYAPSAQTYTQNCGLECGQHPE